MIIEMSTIAASMAAKEHNPAISGGDAQLDQLVGEAVVLDTVEPLIYIGTLTQIGPAGFWLENADLHDCRDGHATKEEYVFDAKIEGIRSNRKRVFVLRSAIISISALADVVQEDLGDQEVRS
jgi:hypothetical protein